MKVWNVDTAWASVFIATDDLATATVTVEGLTSITSAPEFLATALRSSQNTIHQKSALLLLDAQAAKDLEVRSLIGSLDGSDWRGAFLCCCTACPADQTVVNVIESCGAAWCALPASQSKLGEFVQVVFESSAAQSRSIFLTALRTLEEIHRRTSVTKRIQPLQMQSRQVNPWWPYECVVKASVLN